jgi:BirA family biotin operon repressor/biotin-[acetyl-CoA-carboxylase] ligase
LSPSNPLPPSPFPLPPDLAEAFARSRDRLGPFARHTRWYTEVESTNDVAATWCEHGAPEGAVVIADAQTAGRGRYGRSWVSPAAAGLYLSAVLKPPPAVLSLVTIAGGVAAADGVEAATGLSPLLKWPNDLYVGSRKLGGLLAESAGDDSVVLGVGINVLPAAFPLDVAGRATSIEGELGRPIDRALLVTEVLCALARQCAALQQEHSDDVVRAWRRRGDAMLGRTVRWRAGGRVVTGVAQDIDTSGALLVRTASATERIISGEVVWL